MERLDNYGTFEHREGVYLFANVDLQIRYIGKAGAGRMVSEIQSAINRGKDYGAKKVKALYTNSEERTLSLEQALIGNMIYPIIGNMCKISYQPRFFCPMCRRLTGR